VSRLINFISCASFAQRDGLVEQLLRASRFTAAKTWAFSAKIALCLIGTLVALYQEHEYREALTLRLSLKRNHK
jgi:hypothetical protein